MPNPLRRLLLVLGLAALTQASGGQEAAQKPAETAAERLWLRFLPGSQPYQDQELAKLLQPWIEPDIVSVQRGEDLRPLLELRCGGARPGVVTTLEGWNPKVKNAIATEDGEIELPPCPFWTDKLSLPVPSGGNVYSMMLNHMGTAGGESLSEVQKLNPKLHLQSVSAGQRILLPYSTRARSYKLRSDTGSNALAGLDAAFRDLPHVFAKVSVEVGAKFQMIPAVSKERDCPPPGSAASAAWPFARAGLLKVLKKNDRFSRGLSRTAALVVVPDTGIALKEARLFFPRRPKSDDIGMDLVSTGYPAADDQDPYYEHGTRVASLAQGGPAELDGKQGLADSVRRRLAVKVFRIVRRLDRTPKPSFEIKDDAVGDALTLAAQEGGVAAVIVNLSVSSGKESPSLRVLLQQGRTLIVVAAGNSGANLDDNPSKVYPAFYVKDIPQRMIVVGAHDEEGRLAPFSNWGPGVVDLAAPGCRVPGLVPNGAASPASGTSFAAPLVSFAAALLAYEGLRLEQLKNRLLASADRSDDPAWTRRIGRGQRLNLERALDLYSDHVVLKSGGHFAGRLVSPPSGLPLRQELIPWRSCKRLRAVPGTGDFEVYVEQPGGTLSYPTGPLPNLALKLAQDGGPPVSFQLSHVQDLVPAELTRPSR